MDAGEGSIVFFSKQNSLLVVPDLVSALRFRLQAFNFLRGKREW